MRAMPQALHIQAWRLARGHAVSALASKAGLPTNVIESIESGETDPSASTLEALATAIGVPTAWLFAHPTHLDLLLADPDGEMTSPLPTDSVDPVTEHILRAAHHDRALYVLLTSLIQSGDPKLLRAAEVSLRSLVKQSRQTTVPWQTRQPGHFEPPSD